MKLIFIGTGSAFTVGVNNYQSNMVLESKNKQRLLIDCGSDCRFALYDQGWNYRDIHDVYISHFHADHVGGLEWLAFTTMFDPSCKEKLKLHIKDSMAGTLWDNVLSGGLSSLEGVEAKLDTYFDVRPIDAKGCFEWESLKIHLIQTVHSMSGFVLMPSYGLLFEVNKIKVFLTTDSQFNPVQIMKRYEESDIIFQDTETLPFKSGVHAHYTELLSLDPSIKKKMWLYHYNPGPLPDAVKDGFRGFIQKGQVFDFTDFDTLTGNMAESHVRSL